MSANTEVGRAGFGLVDHAVLWHATPASMIHLHPQGMWDSTAVAVHGNTQAGYFRQVGIDYSRAAMWNGSAASFVNLHPPGAISSRAFAVYGDQIGGAVRPVLNGGFKAALWNGPSSAWTNLNPSPQSESLINGMAEGVQVGWAHFPGQNMYAALWSGTAESYINMHPFPGFGASQIYGTAGSIHVGYSHVPGGTASFTQAGVWFGTDPFSFIDLHALLPNGGVGFFTSTAYAVSRVGDTVYIGGSAHRSGGGQEAWLWVGTIPAPGNMALLAVCGVLACRRRR